MVGTQPSELAVDAGLSAGFDGELAGLLVVLEDLLCDPGLADLRSAHPSHVAVGMYDRISAVLTSNSIPFGYEAEFVSTAARLFLDRMTWASGIGVETRLDEVLDVASRRHVIERARAKNSFNDVTAELYFWGWLRSKGFDAYLHEKKGPDIVVEGQRRFWVEVKRIQHSTKPERARDVVKKANKQIRSVDPDGCGILFIHVTRSGESQPLQDVVPTDVQAYIDQIERTLRGHHCRSVAHVVVAWDELFWKQNMQDGSNMFATRRRSTILSHRFPKSDLPVTANELEVGHTTIWHITYPAITELLAEPSDDRIGIDPANVTFWPSFAPEYCPPEGIRPKHVLEALKTADAIAFSKVADIQVILSTKRITHGYKPWVMVVVALRVQGEKLAVAGAYRLYGDDEELAILAADPVKAFAKLLDLFGGEVTVGQATGKLIPEAVVALEEDGVKNTIVTAGTNGPSSPALACIVEFDAQAGKYKTHIWRSDNAPDSMLPFMVKVETGTPAVARVVWAYWIQTDVYRATVRAHQI